MTDLGVNCPINGNLKNRKHGIDYFEIYGMIIMNDYVFTQRSKK